MPRAAFELLPRYLNLKHGKLDHSTTTATAGCLFGLFKDILLSRFYETLLKFCGHGVTIFLPQYCQLTLFQFVSEQEIITVEAQDGDIDINAKIKYTLSAKECKYTKNCTLFNTKTESQIVHIFS